MEGEGGGGGGGVEEEEGGGGREEGGGGATSVYKSGARQITGTLLQTGFMIQGRACWR